MRKRKSYNNKKNSFESAIVNSTNICTLETEKKKKRVVNNLQLFWTVKESKNMEMPKQRESVVADEHVHMDTD